MSEDKLPDLIFSVLADELQQRADSGQPLRINIWDGNHTSPVPRQVFADPRLFEIAKGYGTPVYIAEAVDSESMNPKVQEYINGTDEDRSSIQELFSKVGKAYNADPEQAALYAETMTQLYEHGRNGALIFYPDPRGDNLPGFTEQERGMLKRMLQGLSKLPTIECAGTFQSRFVESLSPDEQGHFYSMVEKFLEFAVDADKEGLDTTDIDAEIKDRVDAKFPDHGMEGKFVLMTMYGFGHFTKASDLDEHFDGISLAVMDQPGAASIMHEDGTGLHTDLPDYVWYSNGQRLVKLDSQDKQREFLGGDDSNELEAEKGPAPIRDNIVAQCEQATSHLKPFGS